jgi:hypothetical protein
MNMNFNLKTKIDIFVGLKWDFTWIFSAWIIGEYERFVRAVVWQRLTDKNVSKPFEFVENGSVASNDEPLVGHSICNWWNFYEKTKSRNFNFTKFSNTVLFIK